MPDEPTSTAQVVGGNLSRLLTEQSMSQAELARRLGVHQTAVSQYVRGDVNMNVTTLQRISDILGTTPCHFFRSGDPVAV